MWEMRSGDLTGVLNEKQLRIRGRTVRKEGKRERRWPLSSARVPSLVLGVELCVLKRCVKVLTPVRVSVILFGHRVFADVIRLR